MIFAKDLKEASVAARRRLSDYPIRIGSDYPITLIFHCFNEEKIKDPVLQLTEGTRIIRVEPTRIIRHADYPVVTYIGLSDIFCCNGYISGRGINTPPSSSGWVPRPKKKSPPLLQAPSSRISLPTHSNSLIFKESKEET